MQGIPDLRIPLEVKNLQKKLDDARIKVLSSKKEVVIKLINGEEERFTDVDVAESKEGVYIVFQIEKGLIFTFPLQNIRKVIVNLESGKTQL